MVSVSFVSAVESEQEDIDRVEITLLSIVKNPVSGSPTVRLLTIIPMLY